MATGLNKFVGTFTPSSGGAGGTQDITNLGFQPSVVIFMAEQPANPSSTEAMFSFGFGGGRVCQWSGDGGVGTSSARTYTDDTLAIALQTTSAGARITASIIALLSNGFRLTWSAAISSGTVNYIALGGSDIANVLTASNFMPTSTGNLTTTVGFTPNFVMLISGSQIATGLKTNANFSYGCAISSSARFAHALTVQNGQTMAASVNGVSIHRNDACLIGLTAGGAATEYVADFVSMDETGFTINFSIAPAQAYNFYYLAIGGSNLQWDVNTAAKPTTATAQSRTGLSFTPEVAWWSNSDLTTLNTITSNAVSLLGSSDGTNTQSFYATHNDSINTVAATQSAAKAAQDGAPANSSGTASFTSFNTDGWTITWDGTGAANQISSVSLAGTLVPPVTGYSRTAQQAALLSFGD